MKELKIRKVYSILDEIRRDKDQKLSDPLKKVVAIAVIENPLSGIYQEDLRTLYDFGEKLGKILSQKALELLSDNERLRVESYGKAVIVGTKGEIEHGHAIIHPKIGAPFRKAIGGAAQARAIIPSTAKIGGVGTSIDIPVHYKDSEWVISHVDTITISVPDAPFENEILIALAITTGGRPNARISGLKKSDVK